MDIHPYIMQAIEAPVRVNQIPRQVPTQPLYMKPVPAVMIGGILPFGAIFIELFFILSSLWYHRVCRKLSFSFSLQASSFAYCVEAFISRRQCLRY